MWCESALFLKAPGAVEARRPADPPGGSRWWQSGPGTVRPADRWDLFEESVDGSGLCPAH